MAGSVSRKTYDLQAEVVELELGRGGPTPPLQLMTLNKKTTSNVRKQLLIDIETWNSCVH